MAIDDDWISEASFLGVAGIVGGAGGIDGGVRGFVGSFAGTGRAATAFI